jgi:phosphoribosylformylglycinamidine (FGAM) synthase-like amidotransferase family enzyme
VAAFPQTKQEVARFGVVVFPGSNCDADTFDAILTFPEAEAR